MQGTARGDASHVARNESHVTLFVKIVLYLRRRRAPNVEGLLTKKYDFSGAIRKREVTRWIYSPSRLTHGWTCIYYVDLYQPGKLYFYMSLILTNTLND